MHGLNNLRTLLQGRRERLLSAVARVIDSGQVVLGLEVQAFERLFGEFVGTGHCIGVGNGTDAIELALRALSIGPGDRVAAAANAGMYAAAATLATGAVPLYLDVDPAFGHLQTDGVDQALDQGARAVIVTHLYGRMVAELPEIAKLCARRGVPLIEDCAHAHGASLGGKAAGSYGHVGCFSFYPTKNLGAIGDAGAVVTDDCALAERVRQLRQYGWQQKYRAALPGGRNSRLDEVQAAVLSCLLPELRNWNARRKAIAVAYYAGVSNPAIRMVAPGGEDDVVHLFVVRTTARERLQEWLTTQGIGCEVHYPVPDYRQPALADRFPTLRLPHTERQAAEVLTLPCHPELVDGAVDEIINALNRWRP